MIFYMAVFRYGTIFGETCETDSAFLLRKAPPGNGSSTVSDRSTSAFSVYQGIDTVVLDGTR